MGLKDILAEYDDGIDEMIEDAHGFHDTVVAMRHDAALEEADALDNQQVSVMAQHMDQAADADEGVPYGDDEEYSLEDLDVLDKVEQTMDVPPKSRQRRKRPLKQHKLAVVVPGSRNGCRVEVVVKGKVIAAKSVPASRKARQIVFDGLPTAKVTVRLVAVVVARTVPLRASGRLDLRAR